MEEASVVEKTKKKSKKPMLIAAIIVVAAIIFGYYYWQMSLMYVKTDDSRVDGSIVNVSPKIGGKIKEIKVKEGDVVKAGQVIAVLDSQELQDQVLQSEAEVLSSVAKLQELQNGNRPQQIKAAQAQAQVAAVNMKNSQKDYQRYQELFRQGAVASQTLDTARAAYEAAAAQYQAAEQQVSLLQAGSRSEDVRAQQAEVTQNQALLNLNKHTLKETIVVSPVDGIVAQKVANPGEVVSTGQSIVNLVNTNDLWLNARIEETKIGGLKIGQPVTFTLDAYNGVKFQGKIREIGAATSSVFSLFSTENASGNFTKVTQRIPIKISLPTDSKYKFRPGMSALIEIKVR